MMMLVFFVAVVVQEEKINAVFDRLYESMPRRQRSLVEEHVSFGPCGFLGIAWAASESTYLMKDHNHVVVLSIGTIESNYSGMEDAEFILNEYQDACNEGKDGMGWTLDTDALAAIKGNFAFLLYDAKHDRLVVLQNAMQRGAKLLYCGSDLESGEMVFSDDEALLLDTCANVKRFPKRFVCIYSSGKDILVEKPLPASKRRRLSKVESVTNCLHLAATPIS